MQNQVLVSRRSRWIAFPLAMLLALVLSSGLAFAGGIRFQDDAGLLSSADRSSLTSTVSSIRPNVLIVTSKSYTNSQQFINFVQNSLPDQNSVVIGVSNSTLRTTVVKAGNNTGINTSEATAAADAGDNFFKNGDFRGGLNAIVQRVGQYATASSSSGSSSSSPATSSSGGGISSLLCLGVGFIALVAVSMFFFSRRGRGGPNIVQQPGPNYNQGYGPGPGYGGPGYGGGYGPGYNQGGGSGLGAGLGGAALGGVIGYELGKNSNDHNNPGYNPNYNQGGGVSDWGNSGGDQGGGLGSSDWGSSGGDQGGSSDWGSSGGGGADFGGGDFGAGGGGDSGGGGGDSSW